MQHLINKVLKYNNDFSLLVVKSYLPAAFQFSNKKFICHPLHSFKIE